MELTVLEIIDIRNEIEIIRIENEELKGRLAKKIKRSLNHKNQKFAHKLRPKPINIEDLFK